MSEQNAGSIIFIDVWDEYRRFWSLQWPLYRRRAMTVLLHRLFFFSLIALSCWPRWWIDTDRDEIFDQKTLNDWNWNTFDISDCQFLMVRSVCNAHRREWMCLTLCGSSHETFVCYLQSLRWVSLSLASSFLSLLFFKSTLRTHQSYLLNRRQFTVWQRFLFTKYLQLNTLNRQKRHPLLRISFIDTLLLDNSIPLI